MPRNGSGVYSLPEAPFVPNTAILSAEVNSDFDDIADALTDSVASDGQTLMTGALRAFAGTLAAPGYSWAVDPNTGRFRSADGEMQDVCNGTLVITYTAAGITIAGTMSVATVAATTLTITGNGTVGGTFGVTGDTALTGNLAINTNKFTVTASNGNTLVAGTLNVTGTLTAAGAISGATATGSMIASQAEMESASATDKLVTPGRQNFHPGTAKFWAKVDSAGNIQVSHNVASVTDLGVGRLRITFTTPFSTTSWVCHVSIAAQSTLIAMVDATPAISASSVDLLCLNLSSVNTDPNYWMVSGYGDQ